MDNFGFKEFLFPVLPSRLGLVVFHILPDAFCNQYHLGSDEIYLIIINKMRFAILTKNIHPCAGHILLN